MNITVKIISCANVKSNIYKYIYRQMATKYLVRGLTVVTIGYCSSNFLWGSQEIHAYIKWRNGAHYYVQFAQFLCRMYVTKLNLE